MQTGYGRGLRPIPLLQGLLVRMGLLLAVGLFSVGCATLMVSPDGQRVVNCGDMAQTPEGVYWSTQTLGITSAVSNSRCVQQLRAVGWLPMEEWQAQASRLEAQNEAARRLWVDDLRPKVQSGALTASQAVEALIRFEQQMIGAGTPLTDQLFALRRMLAEAVDAGTLSLAQAEVIEAEFRKTGRIPEGLPGKRPDGPMRSL